MLLPSAVPKCFTKRQIWWAFLPGASAGSEFCRQIWLTKRERFLPLETVFPEGFGVKILHLANLKNPRALWFNQVFFSAYLVLLFHTLEKSNSASPSPSSSSETVPLWCQIYLPELILLSQVQPRVHCHTRQDEERRNEVLLKEFTLLVAAEESKR